MPFVNVKVAGPTFAPEQVRRLQLRTSELMVSELDRDPAVISILVEQPAISGWSVSGRAALVAAHVDAKITTGTATPEQKANFIRAANQLVKQVLGGDLAVATYVTVTEIPADSWGYDGLTQAERIAAKRPAAN